MAPLTSREALAEMRAHISAMAERHRREQEKLFDDVIAALAAEPAAPIAEPAESAKPEAITSTAGPAVAKPAVASKVVVSPAVPAVEPLSALVPEVASADIVTSSKACKSPAGTANSYRSFGSADSDLRPCPVEGYMVHAETRKWEERAFHTGTDHKRANSKAFRLERAISARLHDAGPLLTWLTVPIFRLLSWTNSLREPPRSGRLARIVDSKLFGLLCFVVIALNAFFIIITTDMEMASHESLPKYLALVEAALVAWYIVELVLKMLVHRIHFLVGHDAPWNWLDVVLVVTSLIDVLAWDAVSSGVNVGFLRSLRFFKLAKVLRIFRTVRFFSELRLMFDCVLGSLVSLVWCLIMIVFIVYVFALLIVQGLVLEIRQPNGQFDEAQLESVQADFGSVALAMMSLFESTTGGRDWGEVYHLLAAKKGFVAWAFLAYIAFFVLAAWNIVTSLFVDKALKLAQPDLETRAWEQNVQDVEDARELTNIFKEVDVDSSGTISLRELESVMTHPRFRSYLRVRGIDIQDARLFHRMMMSVVGEDTKDIDLHFVVSSCLRMKGVASSMDLHALTFESKILNKKHRLHINDVQEKLSRIEESLRMLTTMNCSVRI